MTEVCVFWGETEGSKERQVREGMDEEREGCRERERDVSHSGECLCYVVTGSVSENGEKHITQGKYQHTTFPKSAIYDPCTRLLIHTDIR